MWRLVWLWCGVVRVEAYGCCVVRFFLRGGGSVELVAGEPYVVRRN